MAAASRSIERLTWARGPRASPAASGGSSFVALVVKLDTSTTCPRTRTCATGNRRPTTMQLYLGRNTARICSKGSIAYRLITHRCVRFSSTFKNATSLQMDQVLLTCDMRADERMSKSFGVPPSNASRTAPPTKKTSYPADSTGTIASVFSLGCSMELSTYMLATAGCSDEQAVAKRELNARHLHPSACA